MKLIDADKLILHLNDYALQESPSNVESAEDRKISREVYFAIQNCMKAIEKQPTAFDLDKVVEQLEELKSVEQDDSVAEIVSTRIWNKAIQKSIGIVKGGGVE